MQAGTAIKFKVGDKAVYPAQGVAEVIQIEEKDIAGSRQRFYVLRILDTDRKSWCRSPTRRRRSTSGDKRSRDSRNFRHLERAHHRVRQPDVEPPLPRLHGQDQDGLDLRRRGSAARSLSLVDGQAAFVRRAPAVLDTARSLIVKEIAIAREQTEEQVKTEIESIFVAN